MTAPVERFKDSYKNWRWNPFTDADMAIDAEEDDLVVPSGSPFVVQLLEVPRWNTPTSVSVRVYASSTTVDADSSSGQKVLNVAATTGFSSGDLVIVNRGGAREEECEVDTVQAGVSLTMLVNLTYTHTAVQADDVEEYQEFTEVATTPTQGQYRVDYPPTDGEGTGLIEFNQNDASKVFRVNYKATGSPALEEFLDTKVSYPAGDPADNQIVTFESGAPIWGYSPIRYYHEDNVIYNTVAEGHSMLMFRFKRGTQQKTVKLELKGALLHQGFYSELAQHLHGVGTLDAAAAPDHNHSLSGLVIAAGGGHDHAAGTLAADSGGGHSHADGTLSGSQPNHSHSIIGINHRHASDQGSNGLWTGYANGCDSPTGSDGNDAVTISGNTSTAGGHGHTVSGSVASVGDHTHGASGGSIGDSGAHDHVLSGSTANTGVVAKTYPSDLKVYINGVDKTTEILALTALTELGDGTVGHAFVSTGTGEMDISSLVSAAQFHEIWVTEPTSGKGGRCLLHLEMY